MMLDVRTDLTEPQATPVAPTAPKSSVVEVDTLLGRIGHGAALPARVRARALGYEAVLEEQLDADALDVGPLEAALRQFTPSVFADYAELVRLAGEQGGLFRLAIELQVATLLRGVYSPRQLYESMVGFWSDVFNIQAATPPLIVTKVLDDREVVRAHALGRFRDLLGASARSPAMLIYLDNASNGRAGINENYARELMELHTLGVDGGYDETDVVEVARCFSGWSIDPQRGTFLFRPFWHDNGAKTVLGNAIAAGGGVADGERVLDLLASHPSTAKHIATRLARRLVADRPDPILVDAVAAAFLDSDGDIKTVLRALLLHPLARQAPAAKYKRPQEFQLSALRVLQAQFADGGGRRLLEGLRDLAHLPFQWPAPNGYPDVVNYWLNSNATLQRWNLALQAVRPDSGFRIPWSEHLASVDSLPALVARLAELIGLAPLDVDQAGLWIKTAWLIDDGVPARARRWDQLAPTLAALMLSTERFQHR